MPTTLTSLPTELVEQIACALTDTLPRTPLHHRLRPAEGDEDEIVPFVGPVVDAPGELLRLRATNRKLHAVVDGGWPQLVPEIVAQRAASGLLSPRLLAGPDRKALVVLLQRSRAVNVPGFVLDLSMFRPAPSQQVMFDPPSIVNRRIPQAARWALPFLPHLRHLVHLSSDADLSIEDTNVLGEMLTPTLERARLEFSESAASFPWLRLAQASALTHLQLHTFCLLEDDWYNLLEALPCQLQVLAVRQETHDLDLPERWGPPALQLRARHLTQVHLTTYELGAKALATLLGAQAGVRSLAIDASWDASESWRALLTTWPTSLRALRLREVDDAGGEFPALLGRAAATLRSLTLFSVGPFTPACARALGPTGASLRELTLREIEFDHDSASALGRALPACLQALHLQDNVYDQPSSLAALLYSPPSEIGTLRLFEREVDGQQLGDAPFYLPAGLHTLELACVDLDVGAVAGLLERAPVTLRTLALFDGVLADGDWATLSRRHPQLRLKALHGLGAA